MSMENRNERIFNALLGIAAEESLEDEVGDMPSSEELNRTYVSDDSFARRIRRIILRHEWLNKAKVFLITGLVIMVVVILIVKKITGR